jgi:3-methyladenine DNA glycosylase AlkD
MGAAGRARPDRLIVEAVRATLQEAADPAAAEPMQRYMKSAMPYFGVRVPIVRRLTKAVYDAHRIDDRATWVATFLALYDEAGHREERYAALALVAHRFYRPFVGSDLLVPYEHLVRTGAWWDLVDETAHRVGDVLRVDRTETERVVRAWATSDDLWVRRASIICQVGYRADTDLELLAFTIEPSIGEQDFFLRKAIGWALREAAYVDPGWVRGFVARHDDLSPLSRREALKHLS